ncbi:hypothetical protein M0R19_08275 [Candidatus Pacearchaeota archaeon]|nr:hypothetical protein [Candidatus Pacearchaeota archaeon]
MKKYLKSKLKLVDIKDIDQEKFSIEAYRFLGYCCQNENCEFYNRDVDDKIIKYKLIETATINTFYFDDTFEILSINFCCHCTNCGWDEIYNYGIENPNDLVNDGLIRVITKPLFEIKIIGK